MCRICGERHDVYQYLHKMLVAVYHIYDGGDRFSPRITQQTQRICSNDSVTASHDGHFLSLVRPCSTSLGGCTHSGLQTSELVCHAGEALEASWGCSLCFALVDRRDSSDQLDIRGDKIWDVGVMKRAEVCIWPPVG
jgi:hypothetical protein